MYLLISIFDIFLLTFITLKKFDNNFEKIFYEPIVNNFIAFIIPFIVLFILVGILPERKNWTRFYLIPIWIVFIIYFTLVLSVFIFTWDSNLITFMVITIHHIIITCIVLSVTNFDYRILVSNLILSCFGILFFWL